MELKLIKAQVCPDCGARTVSEECSHVHTNGQGFEHRAFACGCHLRWSPNFGRIECTAPCPNTMETKERERKRLVARNSLIEFIRNLDVDEEWKKHKTTYV